ncbi:VOC family protein [Nonomuraea sp. NPDC050556]|uniref:VOC family protein n=1 Tax=Nonomuraea sp. NPDC050556 TaxID=3364369 RepID=UPI0037A66E07
MPTITPYLWFDNQAEEAAHHYVSIFNDSKILDVKRNDDGSAMLVSFQIEGQKVMALNGGPQFTFSDSFSLYIDCPDQAEVDRVWDALCAKPGPCGWLTDEYGLAWQVIPKRLNELLADPDRDIAQRASQAMFGMTKIDVKALEEACR